MIGDGPHGSAGSGSGDFDFYAVDVVAGQQLDRRHRHADRAAGLDRRRCSTRRQLRRAQRRQVPASLDSLLTFAVHRAVATTCWSAASDSFLPDPFDSGSGFGAGSEGPYDVTITVGAADDDVFAVRLRAGDVLGASVAGAATQIGVCDPAGTLVMGSDPGRLVHLPAPVAAARRRQRRRRARRRRDRLALRRRQRRTRHYDITVEVYRPRLDTERPVQTLFLDFDGARVNTAIFGGPGVRQLSPLRAFLGRWGLRNADLNPLIDRIVADGPGERVARHDRQRPQPRLPGRAS